MKTLLASALIACSLLTGCKKDSARDADPTPVQLEGTWQRMSMHTYRVNAGGSVTYDNLNTTTAATLVITGTTYRETATNAGSTSTVEGTYSRSGSTLTITANSVSQPLTITELTADHLTLQQISHDVDEPNDVETINTRYQR